jgi:tetratricopeptide (TPR) repeat protein
MSRLSILASLAGLLLIAASARALAQAAPPADITAILDKLEVATRNEDAAGVRIRGSRACVCSPAPTRPIARALRYAVAYADFRLAVMPSTSKKDQDAVLQEATTYLEAAIKVSPRDAEAMGLLSSVYGLRIGLSPDLGMVLGPPASDMLDRALKIAPDNPRLQLIRGETLFHTPPEYGGSMKDAESALRHALELFDKEPANKLWPNWGRFDTHVWLGQTLAARNDKAGARAEYEKALQIAPNSAWVKYSLLPAVK